MVLKWIIVNLVINLTFSKSSLLLFSKIVLESLCFWVTYEKNGILSTRSDKAKQNIFVNLCFGGSNITTLPQLGYDY